MNDNNYKQFLDSMKNSEFSTFSIEYQCEEYVSVLITLNGMKYRTIISAL